jgi:hypothetical protein
MAEKEGVVEDTTGATAAADDDEDDDEETAAAPVAWTPPTEAEYKATLAKLNRARSQAKAERLAAEAAKTAANTGAEAVPAGIDPKVLEQAQMRVVRVEAKARLLQEKIDPDMLDLALGRLRAADITFIGDDPDLDEWIDDTKAKFPKLFVTEAAPQASRQPVGRVDQGAAATRTPKTLTFGEKVLAASKAKR